MYIKATNRKICKELKSVGFAMVQKFYVSIVGWELGIAAAQSSELQSRRIVAWRIVLEYSRCFRSPTGYLILLVPCTPRTSATKPNKASHRLLSRIFRNMANKEISRERF